MEDVLIPLYLFLAGAAASFINMMAGGGSVLTLGVMMLVGIDPSVANGTNRIGVVAGTGSGVLAFRSEKYTDLKQSLIYGAFAIPGAIIGSLFSIQLDDIVFQRIIAVVMIFVLLTLFLPKKKKNSVSTSRRSIWIYPAMFAIGLYGGFIQVGVGFLLMAALRHLMEFDLIRTNMHKVFVVLIYTLPVLLVFGISGNINWFYAIVMSSGNALGSWVSVKLSVKKGEKLVKVVLAIAIILMAIRFIFV